LPWSRAYLFYSVIKLVEYLEKNTIGMGNDQRTPSEWGTIFGDAAAASAALDRLIHHCTPVAIMGDSYRARKNKLKRAMKV